MSKSYYKNLPNLIIIGAQKAGTTSLFNWLAQHPEIYGDEALKDFNFFLDDFYYKELGIEWFAKQFKPKNEKIIMHGFVNYMYFYDVAVERLYEYKKRYRPDLKLIAILRNPVDRAYSAFWDAKKVAQENLESFEDAIKREKFILENGSFKEKIFLTYLDHGFYCRQLISFLNIFDQSIKVIIFEELMQKRQEVMLGIYDWLEVDKYFTPKFTKLNEAGIVRIKSLQKLIQKAKLPKFIKRKYPFFLMFGNLKRKFLREWNIKNSHYPKLQSELRKNLYKIYEKDIICLSKLLEKDLKKIWLENY